MTAVIARTSEPLMTSRDLNRAVLARQRLLEHAELALDSAVEAVGALQAQYPPAPAVALWSRVRGLTMEGYRSAMEGRRLVTALLMRGTLHVVSGRGYWPLATAVHAIAKRAPAPGGPGDVDTAGLRARLAALAGGGQVSHDAVMVSIREWLADQGHDPDDPQVARAGRLAWRTVRGSTSLLNVQSRGDWGRSATDAYVGARSAVPLASPTSDDEALAFLVRHHLGAFGPAAVEDIASWAGVPRPAALRPVLEALAPELRRFRDEAGRLLYDLTGAPRPGADVPAPPRYLPWFDSLLLAYAPRFRGRVLPEPYRTAVIRTANLQVLPTFLVDGLVAGTWETRTRRRTAALVLRPFASLAARTRQALLAEGELLLRFLHADAGAHEVLVEEG